MEATWSRHSVTLSSTSDKHCRRKVSSSVTSSVTFSKAARQQRWLPPWLEKRKNCGRPWRSTRLSRSKRRLRWRRRSLASTGSVLTIKRHFTMWRTSCTMVHFTSDLRTSRCKWFSTPGQIGSWLKAKIVRRARVQSMIRTNRPISIDEQLCRRTGRMGRLSTCRATESRIKCAWAEARTALVPSLGF